MMYVMCAKQEQFEGCPEHSEPSAKPDGAAEDECLLPMCTSAVTDGLAEFAEQLFGAGCQRHKTHRMDEAVRLYSEAANLGHLGATCNLGLCFQHGLGVDADWLHAHECYLRAALAGHAVSQVSSQRAVPRSLELCRRFTLRAIPRCMRPNLPYDLHKHRHTTYSCAVQPCSAVPNWQQGQPCRFRQGRAVARPDRCIHPPPLNQSNRSHISARTAQ